VVNYKWLNVPSKASNGEKTMKVKELRAILSKVNQEAEVCLLNVYDPGFYKICNYCYDEKEEKDIIIFNPDTSIGPLDLRDLKYYKEEGTVQ
jgi:hypothetical protein